METVLSSRHKTVVIGPDRPFCIIGERINPTGRKAFQAQLQANDISQLDRTYGRVSLRKVFAVVQTANTDTYLGAHIILTDPPTSLVPTRTR